MDESLSVFLLFTCRKKRLFFVAQQSMFSPCECFPQLFVMIETGYRFPKFVPEGCILTHPTLHIQIIICLAQPLSQTRPTANQGFMADFNSCWALFFCGRQEACCEEQRRYVLQHCHFAC